MRNSLALRTLFRSPLKTLLTVLLIASASFVLFSRITDYAIITRETKDAKGFYHGVAALDDTVPGYEVADYYITPGDKPWPAEEELEAFSSLPGV